MLYLIPYCTGTLIVRGTRDADQHLHPISVSYMIAAESNLSVGAHIDAEKLLLEEELNKANRVTVVDGGLALVGQMKKKLPNVKIMRCSRHLRQDFIRSSHARAYTQEFDKLVKLPTGATEAAARLLAKLPDHHPLKHVPAEETCAALLPEPACTFGVTTNNFAEVLNMMLMPVRTEDSLFQSLLQMEALLWKRQNQLGKGMLSVKKGVVTDDASPNSWPANTAVPHVENMNVRVREEAATLANGRLLGVTDADDGSESLTYFVEYSAGSIQRMSCY